MISLGKGQCLSEAEEEPRVEPEALPRCNESTDFPRGIMGLISHWEGIQPTYTMPRLLVCCVDIDTVVWTLTDWWQRHPLCLTEAAVKAQVLY